MFKRSKEGTLRDMFSAIPSLLRGVSYEQYSYDTTWDNFIRSQIVEWVDELIFKPLYDETMDGKANRFCLVENRRN